MVTNVKVPTWLAGYLPGSNKTLEQIEDAVRQAEKSTAAEIVPMVVRGSTVTGHVTPVLILLLLIIYLLLGGPRLLNQLGTWSLLPHFVTLALLFLFAWFAGRAPAVQRRLTPAADIQQQVMRRAAVEFYEAGLNNTVEATGILLFVSLAERRAVVLADRTIAAKLPPETWQEVVNLLIQGMRRGNLGQAFIDAIRRTSELATPLFPPRPNDTDELSDALVIKD